jgi:hypothetical protein
VNNAAVDILQRRPVRRFSLKGIIQIGATSVYGVVTSAGRLDFGGRRMRDVRTNAELEALHAGGEGRGRLRGA